MPPNGEAAVNLILANENVADHLTHFYLFFMPDFAREVYAGEPWHAPVAARFQGRVGIGGPAGPAGAGGLHAPDGTAGGEVAAHPGDPARRHDPLGGGPGADAHRQHPLRVSPLSRIRPVRRYPGNPPRAGLPGGVARLGGTAFPGTQRFLPFSAYRGRAAAGGARAGKRRVHELRGLCQPRQPPVRPGRVEGRCPVRHSIRS